MSNRKVLAAVVLAAALVFPSVSRATPMVMAEQTTPQWGYALGMNREEALVLGVGGAVMCGFIPGIGSVACGITGAL